MNPVQQPSHSVSSRTVAAIMAMLCVVQPAYPQIVADPNAAGGKRPVVDNTANGRPLVQIATPSAAGVSHNQYSQFNVGPNGAILNNARDVVLTQQGGYVGANPNLQGGAARVILNEVTSSLPSQLRGYTEVAGQRAEVVIANPNGITCDGCGFINTSRGVLTTGVPLFGGDGSLEAFRVTRGAIQVGAGGLNGANVDQLDLIARSVQVNGELWGDKLNVVTGANRVNYSDLGLSVVAGEGNVPTLGLDVARMGGMYANKIMLVGTENGVGVRSLGNLAAQAGSFTLTSKGQIDLAGKTSASDNLTLKTDGDITNGGTVYAGKNADLQGARIDNAGTLSAQGDLSVAAAQLHSSGTLAAGADSDGNISQAGNLTVAASGDVAMNGANQAGADLLITGANIDLSGSRSGAGGRLTVAAQGAIDAGAAAIDAQADLDMSGSAIRLDGAKTYAGADIRLNSAGALSNRGGEISGVRALTLQAASVDNTGGVMAAGTGGAGAFSLGTAGDVNNDQGRLAAGAEFSATARTIQGTGNIIANGDATIDVQTLTNTAGSTIQSNHDLKITASGTVRNQGALKAVGALSVGAGQIENAAGGEISSASTALDAGAGDIVNAGKIGGAAIATTSGGLNNQGAIIGGDITLNAARLTNSGAAAAIAATGSVRAFVRDALLNEDSALIYSLGNLVIAADATQGATGDYLHRTGTLTNSSAAIEAGGDLAVSADTIVNRRTTLAIQRDIFDGSESWQKYNYYWRSWGPGMSGADSAGLMAAVTRTLPFNDANAFGSQYGSILQVDASSSRALIQFQGSNQLWVSYKAIKQNADGSYDMTFYEGKNCGGSALCPYQQMVWREYPGRLVEDQFDPSRYISPAELNGIGTNGESAYDFRERSYSGSNYHDAVTAISAASRLNAAGRINISTASLTNDASDIIAGGALAINGAGATGASGGVVNNIGYSVNKTVISTSVDHYDRNVGHHTYTTINSTDVTALQTIDANIQSNQTVAISAQNISNTTVGAAAVPTRGNGAGNPSISLPAGGLFSVRPEPGQRYLVETDSRFTDYKTFLGSDYMLGRLTMDPSMTQKRLGDGFYEQKLINDQISELTGKKFLDGYSSAEAQYKALMDSGVASATNFKLTPGIALTGEQMAALTSDIVWMVDTEVTLADGSKQHALVPTVYLAHGGSAQLQPSGALIGGSDVTLAADTVNNSGIVRADDKLAVQARDINNVGGELRGDKVDVQASGTLNIATDFQNAGRQGAVVGNQVSLAGNDVNIIGGKVKAGDSLKVAADNNLTITAATAQRDINLAWSGAGEMPENYGMMRAGGISAHLQQAMGSSIEATGDASFTSGKNIAVHGSNIDVAGNASLLASGSIDIGAVKTTEDNVVTGRSDRYDLTVNGHTENLVSSTISGGKGLSVVALGQNGSSGDINIAASGLASKAGEVTVNAAGDINITSAQKNRDNKIDERGGKAWMKTNDSASVAVGSAIEGEKGVNLIAKGSSDGKVAITGSDVYSNGTIAIQANGDVTIAESRSTSSEWQQAHSESRGFLSRSSSDRLDQIRQDIANGSTISGDKVVIESGKNIAVRGSDVVSTELTSLRAANDVTITTTQNLTEQSHYKEERKSGLMGAGFGISIGSKGQEANGSGASVHNNASTVGSVDGNVNIIAGNAYSQTGSQVVAPQGDINIIAKSVDIGAAYDASTYTQENKYKQSGLTLAINSPVVSMLQTGQQLIQAGGKTSDTRMQALAAASAAKSIYEGGSALANNPTDTTGVKITLSLGSSQSSSTVTQASSTAVGSTVGAGGTVNIIASGGNERSDINVIGSAISGGADVNLMADHQINLAASQSVASQHGNNSNSGASIGIGFAMGGSQNGFTLELGANRGRGNSDGDDVINNATTISAGNRASLISKDDTNLRGATVTAATVAAAIGGNLNIESLQDTSTYNSKQNSAGIGLSLCVPPFCYGASSVSGSLSASKAKGDYQSVVTQAGIKAGDGGYQIAVAGNTDLKGAVIASTAKATEDDRNFLQTGSLTYSDIKNHDSYEASGYSVSGSLSSKVGDQSKPPTKADEKAANTPTGLGGSPGYSDAEGSQSSVTRSGVSGGTIIITDAAAQKSANGMEVAQLLASLNRDVDSTRDSSGALSKAWDGEALRQQVEAEARIVQAFGQTAAKTIADYADTKKLQLQTAAEAAEKDGNSALALKLKEEAAAWDEGGISRVAAHTAAGLLSGGLAGGLGAAASAQLMPALAARIKEMGLPEELQGVVAAAAAAGIGAIVGGGAGVATAVNVDLNNRQLHQSERALLSKLAKDKAVAICGADADCVTRQTLFWSDMLERVANGKVDNVEAAKNLDYLAKLASASMVPDSEGARGGLEAYLNAWRSAEALLQPYVGTPILVNGVPAFGDGSAQTYFSATEAQRSDRFLNAFLGSFADPLAAGRPERDADRLERFLAQNGSALKDYFFEENILGGRFATKALGLLGRLLGNETDLFFAGTVSPSAKGYIGVGKVTMEGLSVKLSSAELSLLQQIDKLQTVEAQAALRELVSDSYFVQNGYKSFNGKCGVNCFDGVYLKGNTVFVNEVKPLASNGSIALNGDAPGLPTQMTDAWIENAALRLAKTGSPEAIETAKMILDAMNQGRLVKVVTAVDSKSITLIKLAGD